jgi:hypothetical protein
MVLCRLEAALDGAQQLGDPRLFVEGDAHRDGVDEETDHRLDARHFGGTAGDDGAEEDVVLIAVAV